MIKYRSKVSLLIPATALIVGNTPVILGIIAKEISLTLGLILIIVITASILPILCISYIIDGDNLEIRFMYFLRQRYKIDDLEEISKTSNLTAAPAASVNRLCLKFRNGQTALISPVRQQDFIGSLLGINPKIKIHL